LTDCQTPIHAVGTDEGAFVGRWWPKVVVALCALNTAIFLYYFSIAQFPLPFWDAFDWIDRYLWDFRSITALGGVEDSLPSPLRFLEFLVLYFGVPGSDPRHCGRWA
jgi:hypothetical protein